MRLFKPTAAVLSLCAAGSIAATDVAAAELPLPSAPVAVDMPGAFDSQAMEADNHRYYPYGYRRYRRSTASDILTGVLIIGTVAAIANAASKNSRDRDYRYRDRDYRDRDYRDRDYRDRDYRYRERRGDSRYDESRGIDRAVEMCVREVERDARVDRVDSVERDGNGWEVEGRLYNGEEFSCEIGADGRIEDIEIDGRDVAFVGSGEGSNAAVEDRQWDDQRYAQARAQMDRAPLPTQSSQQPAYPGGPIPGDEVDADLGGDDGRYQTHTAPDFEEA